MMTLDRPITATDIQLVLARLMPLAMSDTGQSRIVANFLLSWWNSADCGGFAISDLFCLDLALSADLAALFSYLGQRPGAIYIDTFGYRDHMAKLAEKWR